MMQLLRSVKARVREFLLLEEQERRNSALTSTQRESSRMYYDVAVRRLRAAQQVRLQSELSAALLLYQQGGFCLALAYLISKEPNLKADAIDAAAAFDKLDSTLGADRQAIPPYFTKAKPFLVSTDPFEFDRLAVDEAQRLAEEFEMTAAWLSRLLNPMTQGEIKVKRILRISIVGLVLVGMLVSVAVWAFTPPNLALHKRATSSSQAYETTPDGA